MIDQNWVVFQNKPNDQSDCSILIDSSGRFSKTNQTTNQIGGFWLTVLLNFPKQTSFRCLWFQKMQEKGCLGHERKIWNASRICVSSLRRGHANLLCIVPILVYVMPKQTRPVDGHLCYLKATLLQRNSYAVQKVYGTRSSQAVPHPSTILARRCLTSVIGRERVYSSWYGRRHRKVARTRCGAGVLISVWEKIMNFWVFLKRSWQGLFFFFFFFFFFEI